jgi:hypothetical protein
LISNLAAWSPDIVVTRDNGVNILRRHSTGWQYEATLSDPYGAFMLFRIGVNIFQGPVPEIIIHTSTIHYLSPDEEMIGVGFRMYIAKYVGGVWSNPQFLDLLLPYYDENYDYLITDIKNYGNYLLVGFREQSYSPYEVAMANAPTTTRVTAFAFRREGDNFVPGGVLVSDDKDIAQVGGIQVALDGNTAATLYYRIVDQNSQSVVGVLKVYEQQGESWHLTYEEEIDRWSAGTMGYTQLVIHDEFIFVSHVPESRVHVYRREGAAWGLLTTIQAIETGPWDLFGYKIAADGRNLFISAPGRTVNGFPSAGAVDVYLLPEPQTPPTPTQTPPVSNELLVNGGFEAVGNNGSASAKNWAWRGRGTRDGRACNLVGRPGKPDKFFAHTGNCALRVTGKAGKQAEITQTVKLSAPLPAGDILRLTAWAKRVNTTAPARVIAMLTYDNNTTARLTLPLPKDNDQYAGFSKDLLLAHRVKTIKLHVRYWGARGTIWFDDLSLLAIEATALSRSEIPNRSWPGELRAP